MEEREGAQVAEITSWLDLSPWPRGARVLMRREEPQPGASYNLFDPHGLRHQALITNSQDLDTAYLEARHRLHARVEDWIKEAKECGPCQLPLLQLPGQPGLALAGAQRPADHPAAQCPLALGARTGSGLHEPADATADHLTPPRQAVRSRCLLPAPPQLLEPCHRADPGAIQAVPFGPYWCVPTVTSHR